MDYLTICVQIYHFCYNLSIPLVHVQHQHLLGLHDLMHTFKRMNHLLASTNPKLIT